MIYIIINLLFNAVLDHGSRRTAPYHKKLCHLEIIICETVNYIEWNLIQLHGNKLLHHGIISYMNTTYIGVAISAGRLAHDQQKLRRHNRFFKLGNYGIERILGNVLMYNVQWSLVWTTTGTNDHLPHPTVLSCTDYLPMLFNLVPTTTWSTRPTTIKSRQNDQLSTPICDHNRPTTNTNTRPVDWFNVSFYISTTNRLITRHTDGGSPLWRPISHLHCTFFCQ